MVLCAWFHKIIQTVTCNITWLVTWTVPSVLWHCWLGGRKSIRPVKTERWGAGMVVCLVRGADLHMAQRVPLPLTVSCSCKIQIGFTFLVPAHLGSPGQRAIKRMCVCVTWTWIKDRLMYLIKIYRSTRSSAIAEGPRDAWCQLKSCQLPCNSPGTAHTTSPD